MAALQLWVLSPAADQASGKRDDFPYGGNASLTSTGEKPAAVGTGLLRGRIVIFPSFGPFLVLLSISLTHALH